VGARAGLDGRKISSQPGLDPGPSSPSSDAIPTELPGPFLFCRILSKWPAGLLLVAKGSGEQVGLSLKHIRPKPPPSLLSRIHFKCL